MKTEMKMLPNGNYESVICPIQHECWSKDCLWECKEYSWDMGNLHLKHEEGDPYEDGHECELIVAFCPFCGYMPSQYKPGGR